MLKRIVKLKQGLLSLLFLLFAITSLQAQSNHQPMNVLFLVADDLNTWLLHDQNRYTGKVAAPGMQELAKQGVLFNRNYCASPKCSPSRTSILSGMAPWKTGIYQNAQLISESEALKAAISLPQYLKEHGYYISASGKIGHGYEGADWDRRLPHRRDPRPPGDTKGYGIIHLDESEMGDTKYADFAIEELNKHHDKPFFIACGMFHPHSPWYVPEKYLDLYPIEDLVLPEINENDLDDIPEEGFELADPKEHEKNVEKGIVKEKIQAYLASTSYADAQLKRVLDALDASPYKENTIVVLWSDHGYHLSEKLHWGKGTLWEEGTHALLMFRVPQVTKPMQECDRFVSLIDIYPTLVELCGLPTPDHLDGNSLVPLLKNPEMEWDKPVLTGYTEKWELDVFMSVRTDQYRYIRYGEGSEEFYNCVEDPHEWNNLIENKKYQKKIRNLVEMVPDFVDALPYNK